MRPLLVTLEGDQPTGQVKQSNAIRCDQERRFRTLMITMTQKHIGKSPFGIYLSRSCLKVEFKGMMRTLGCGVSVYPRSDVLTGTCLVYSYDHSVKVSTILSGAIQCRSGLRAQPTNRSFGMRHHRRAREGKW